MAFTCADCGNSFSLPPSVLTKFPGWVPRQCLDCRDTRPRRASGTSSPAAPGSPRRPSITRTQDLSTSQVLERFHDGPTTGIFTDGSARPNPGPGGWGAVFVRENIPVAERHGSEAFTTNNRMEFTAMIEGLELAPPDEALPVFTDSQLVVNTLTRWASGWEKRGWRRKEGEIANLDLVKRAWELVQAKPRISIQWIKAHDGSRWNEYADALSTAHLRPEV